MKAFKIKTKFNIIRKYAPFFVEFLSVLSGLKPVMRTRELSENEIKEIMFLCKKYNLHCLISGVPQYIKDIQKIDRNSKHVFISKNEQLLTKAASYDSRGPSTLFGELLGYPSCCIKFHHSYVEDDHYNMQSENLQKESYLNTVGEANNLLNNLVPVPFISHCPCSYNCAESITYAKKVAKALSDFDEKYYQKVYSHLKGNFICLRESKDSPYLETRIKFIGENKKNKIYYSDSFLYTDPQNLSKELKEAFSRCNCVELVDNTLFLYNKDKSFKFKLKDAFIIKFSGQ